MALQKETVRVEGFEAVLKALAESKKVTRARLSIKVQDAERELVQKVKQAAPLGETGALRESITAHPGKGLVGYVGIQGGEIRGQRPDIYYRFPEFGTQNAPQKPYIRPTTNAYAERFLNVLRSAGAEIERDLTGGGGAAVSSPLAMPAVQVAAVQALSADAALVALLAPAPANVGGGPGIYGGRAPQGAAKPYLVVEVGDEVPLNTMGPPTALKYGSNAGLVIRAVTTSYRDTPALEIQTEVKRILDEQPLTVAPYQSVCSEFEQLQPPIISTVSGVEIREHLSLYRFYVHQGGAVRPEELLVHLRALHWHIEALMVAIQYDIDARRPPVPVSSDLCLHPTEHRRDNSTMTRQAWRCMACGEEFEGVA